MKFDETELVDFFGVLPTEQIPQEQEFFGTTIFDFHQNDFHLSISFSAYREDFYLFLKAKELLAPLLDLRLEGVQEIKIRRDKPTSAPVLVVGLKGNVGSDADQMISAVEVNLEPNICVRVKSGSE